MGAEPNLNLISDALRAHPEIAYSERGEKRSRFLYLTSRSRAAEISVSDGVFWLEGWETADPNSDDPPTTNLTARDVTEALIFLRHWMV